MTRWNRLLMFFGLYYHAPELEAVFQRFADDAKHYDYPSIRAEAITAKKIDGNRVGYHPAFGFYPKEPRQNLTSVPPAQ